MKRVKKAGIIFLALVFITTFFTSFGSYAYRIEDECEYI